MEKLHSVISVTSENFSTSQLEETDYMKNALWLD